jgi:hypothetical protein
MTLGEFETAWAITVNSTWVKNQFRDAAPRKHEWIPCEKILDVIMAARTASEEAHDVSWIEFHHAMRSPTKNIIFSPTSEYGTGYKTINGNNVQVLCGHSGNLYVMIPGEAEPVPCTGNQNLWHTALGKLFEPKNGIGAVRAALEDFFRKTVWDGSGSLPASIYKDYVDSKGAKIPFSTITGGQAKRFQDIEADFDNAKSFG